MSIDTELEAYITSFDEIEGKRPDSLIGKPFDRDTFLEKFWQEYGNGIEKSIDMRRWTAKNLYSVIQYFATSTDSKISELLQLFYEVFPIERESMEYYIQSQAIA